MNWSRKVDNTAWLRQTPDKPIFEDLVWSRPENKQARGKLLIIGGNKHGFAAPGSAYTAAVKSGIGTARVLLPESLRKVVGQSLLEADFAPSNLSGSFSKKALADFLDHASWADGVLLAGDFGRNSETAVLLDSFLQKYQGPVSIAQDALDYFLHPNSFIIGRYNTVITINMGKLQKLAKNTRPQALIRHAMGLKELVEVLGHWTSDDSVSFITKHQGGLIAASGGKVSTTADETENNWQVNLATYSAVWQLQNPGKSFEAITTAVFEYLNENSAPGNATTA